jgi:hypothetical protein
VRHFYVVAELEQIKAALAQHAPTIECVDYCETPTATHDLARLEPHNVETTDVVAEMMLVGRYLGYRVVMFGNGDFAVSGIQLDRQEDPRVLLNYEPRWRTVAWFVSLCESNKLKSVWLHGLDLRDAHGKVVLSIA